MIRTSTIRIVCCSLKPPYDDPATLAEICAMAADAAIEDVNGLSAPDRLEVIKDDAHFACKEYEQPLKDLAIRLATKFATAKVEGWNSTTLMNGNL